MMLWCAIFLFSLLALVAKAAGFDESACDSCVAKGCTYCVFVDDVYSTPDFCSSVSLDPSTGRCSDHTDCSLLEGDAESLSSQVDCFFEIEEGEAALAVAIVVSLLILCCCCCCCVWISRNRRAQHQHPNSNTMQQQPPAPVYNSSAATSSKAPTTTTTTTSVPYYTAAGVIVPPTVFAEQASAPSDATTVVTLPPSTNPSYISQRQGDVVPTATAYYADTTKDVRS